MDSPANWVTAIATVIYKIGTFALWWTTRQSLNAARDAFKLNLIMGIHHIRQTSLGETNFIAGIRGKVYRDRVEALLKRTFPDDYQLLVGNETQSKTEQS